MKNLSILTALFILSFLITGCRPDPVFNPGDEFGIACHELNNGTISLKVNGKEWNSNCLIVINLGGIIGGDDYKAFHLIAYGFEDGFFADSGLETFFLTYSENTEDGKTTIQTSAAFYEGKYDNARADDPDYEFIGQLFNSNSDEKSEITISNFTTDNAKGIVNFDLFESTSNERVSVTGSFDLVLN